MLKRLVLLFVLVLSGCFSAPKPFEYTIKIIRPGHLYGQDVLGLARQDVSMISSHWKDGEGLGVLAGAFGPAVKAVTEVVEPNVVPFVRWHLSFCNHNNQCTPGECQPTDLPCMKKKAKNINQFHAEHPSAECYISPRLEYNERDCKLVNLWFKVVSKAAPLCTMVASAVPGACVPSGVLVEHHGNTPGVADSVSNDGQSAFDVDSISYNKLGKVLNLKWINRYNLRLTSEHATAPLPPLQRPLAYRVGLQDFRNAQLLNEPLSPMPVPSWCFSFRQLKGSETYKPHAEEYPTSPDGRSNKPLLITTILGLQLPIYNAHGDVVSCMNYFGPYGSLRRFYVGSCSGDHAMDLYKKAGEWVFIKDGNKCIGLPAVRRWGTYH